MTRCIKMVPWEKYMLADDHERYPMTCHLRFWFDGTFDREVFAEALREALLRHPLLTAFLSSDPFRYGWRLEQPDMAAQLSWLDGFDNVKWQRVTGSDFRVRFIVAEEQGKTLLAVRFHHSVCDGIGINQVVEDMLILYAAKLAGQPAVLPRIDPELLLRRGDFHTSLWRTLPTLHWQLLRILKFFKRWPATLRWGPDIAAKPGASADPGAAVRVVLSKEQTKAIAHTCKARSITMNDLLIAALYEALDERQPEPRNAAFRIAVPTSLRLPQDAAAPAANMVSMVFLDRSRQQIAQRDALIAGIAKEMQHIKDKRLGLAMILVCNLLTSPFALMRAFMQLPLTQTSIVLTNLGRPFASSSLLASDGLLHAGNVVMTGYDTFPPIRARTRASISVNGYGGALSLTARFDSTTVRAEDVRDFLRAYIARLQS